MRRFDVRSPFQWHRRVPIERVLRIAGADRERNAPSLDWRSGVSRETVTPGGRSDSDSTPHITGRSSGAERTRSGPGAVGASVGCGPVSTRCGRAPDPVWMQGCWATELCGSGVQSIRRQAVPDGVGWSAGEFCRYSVFHVKHRGAGVREWEQGGSPRTCPDSLTPCVSTHHPVTGDGQSRVRPYTDSARGVEIRARAQGRGLGLENILGAGRLVEFTVIELRRPSAPPP